MLPRLCTTLPPDLNTTVGCSSISLAVNVSITKSSIGTSWSFARVVGLLVDTSRALLAPAAIVGAILSNVTLPEPLVTDVPEFPASSSKEIL